MLSQRTAFANRSRGRVLAIELLEERVVLSGVVTGTSGDDYIGNFYRADDGTGTEHLYVTVWDAHEPWTPGDGLVDLGPSAAISDIAIHAGGGNDLIYGCDGLPNTIYGESGIDSIHGSNASDHIYGGSQADLIFGNGGDDLIDAGSGDDNVHTGPGDNTVLAGEGNDQFNFSENSVGILFDAGAGNDRVAGSAYDDVIIGGSGDDIIGGGSGADQLNGGTGNDALSGGSGNDYLEDPSGENILQGDDGQDTLIGGEDIDILEGGDGDDPLLDGRGGDDTLRGGAGDDVLRGRDGHDIYVIGANVGNGNDDLAELNSEGFDTLYLEFETSDIDVDISNRDLLGLGTNIVSQSGYSASAQGTERFFEQIITGSGNDRVVGNDLDNFILTQEGVDVVYGLRGRDALIGGLGIDSIHAEGDHSVCVGDEIYIPNGSLDLILQLERMAVILGDLQQGILNLPDGLAMNGAGEDTITSLGSHTFVVGGDGADTIEASGTHSLVFSDSFSAVPGVWFDFGSQFDNSRPSVDLHLSGQNLLGMITTGGAGDDVITGGTDSTVLFAGSGDDKFTATDGANMVFGSDGDDSMQGRTGIDIFDGGAGTDMIIGGDGDDYLVGGDDFDVMMGDSFDFPSDAIFDEFESSLRSGILLVSATLTPLGSGNDTIRDEEGDNLIVGGGGNDDIRVDNGHSVIVGDSFEVSANVNFDFEQFLVDLILPDPLDFFEPTSGPFLDAFKFLDNFNLAQTGNDTIKGGLGFNLLIGGGGEDDLTAGAGLASCAFGGGEADTIDLSSSNIGVAFGGDGADLIDGAQTLGLLVGEGGDDVLTGGGGIDVLLGDSYTLTVPDWSQLANNLLNYKLSLQVVAVPFGNGNDTLNGGDGIDILIGGGGNDALDGGDGGAHLGGLLFGDGLEIDVGPSIDFAAFMSGDQAAASKGIWSIAWDLIGLPNIKLTGSGRDTIVGGDCIDLIFGGDDVDSINTGGGFADIAFGNNGSDTIDGTNSLLGLLVGGEGNDTLMGPAALLSGSLVIGDTFDLAGLPSPFPKINIDFENGLYSNVTWDAGLLSSGNGNDTLTSNSFFNVMIGGDGDDTLTGGNGLNVMLGDTINFGYDFTFDFVDVDRGKTVDERLARLTDHFRLPGLAGDGEDTITGGDLFNVVIAGDGIDDIYGGTGGIDLLFGNDGDDDIDGQDGFNVIAGGEGLDHLWGGNDGNIILGDTFDFSAPGVIDFEAIKSGRFLSNIGITAAGSGNDRIWGGTDFDLIIGGDGSDTISDPAGTNLVLGDSLNFSPNSNFDITGTFTAAAQSVFFNNPNALLQSLASLFDLTGNGNDTYQGGSDIDVVLGGAGDDTISGGDGDYDVLIGGHGNDNIDGMGDRDILFGGPGDDLITGGPGDDYLESEGGADEFHGGVGSDTIYGGADNDVIYGDAGDDFLYGETGDDVIDGGVGSDYVHGGSGDNQIANAESIAVDGDFNNDDIYDSQDIDLLVFEIAAVVHNPSFDLTGDALVGLADRNAWLAEAGFWNLMSGSPYLLGDANLDGVVDTSDFNVWNTNKFTSVAAWSAGDFNADGVVDTSDFNIWNTAKFTSSDLLLRQLPVGVGVPLGADRTSSVRSMTGWHGRAVDSVLAEWLHSLSEEKERAERGVRSAIEVNPY